MHYVYILRSESHPKQTCVGLTQDLPQRLREHNSWKSAHTRKFVPWRPVVYVALSNKKQAEDFEVYLKSGSGRAFAKRQLW